MSNDILDTPTRNRPRPRRRPQSPDQARAGAKLINSPNSGIALRDSVTLSVNQNGYCVLNYSATVCGKSDFVGVYVNASQPEGSDLDSEDCDDTSDFPYLTSVAAQVGLVAIYWSWDYANGDWVAVAITPALSSTAPGTSVTGYST
ncbi:MAG: hypothetical protein QM820_62515 [Minicystis sp.]